MTGRDMPMENPAGGGGGEISSESIYLSELGIVMWEFDEISEARKLIKRMEMVSETWRT